MFSTPPYTPVGGFLENLAGGLAARLRAGWLNYVGAQLPNALDAVNGGYYQFVDDIELSSDTKQIKINSPHSGHQTELRGWVTIGLSDDVNYTTGTGELTVDIPATLSVGLVVTQSATNTNAITATGNGTGFGIEATGGATNASGGKFTGGATNAYGVEAYGSGAGPGVYGLGGATGRGGFFEGGGGNAIGVQGTGKGTGEGVYGIGGTTGPGGHFIGNAGDATAEAIRADGYILMNGTDVAPGVDAGPSKLYPALVPKAWGTITTDGAGAVAKNDDVGIASVSFTGQMIHVVLAHAMTNTNYAIILTNGNGAIFMVPAVFKANTTTTAFDVICKREDGTSTGTTYNATTTALTVNVLVFGRH